MRTVHAQQHASIWLHAWLASSLECSAPKLDGKLNCLWPPYLILSALQCQCDVNHRLMLIFGWLLHEDVNRWPTIAICMPSYVYDRIGLLRTDRRQQVRNSRSIIVDQRTASHTGK